ncbi:MAG: hypothetical protein DRJ65_22670 [Acidobacteria bacterium]|nr:MAG: hypothetical protein DRJ65_22670 [Acidobacteriota bacterium]
MIRNLGWAFLHHGVGRGALFVFFLALPWLMGAEDVGRLTFTYTLLLLILQPLLDTAIGTIITKYTARETLPRVRHVLRFLVTAIVSAIVGITAASLLIPDQVPILPLLGAAVLGAIALNAVFSWRRGLDDFRMEGIVGTAHKVMVLLALVLLVSVGVTGPTVAAMAMLIGVIGAWALAGTAFADILRQFGRLMVPAPSDDTSTTALLREGIVLSAVGVVGLLYLRIDIVMLGLLSGEAEVGLYFTAARVLEASFIVPHIVMLVVFPRLALIKEKHPLLRRTVIGLGLSGLLAALALAGAGRWLIPQIYGADWVRTGDILVLLSLAAPAVFLGYCLTQALTARDLQERYLVVALIGLGLNIGLNLILIPRFGGMGAAGATVVTEIVVTAGAGAALFWRDRS